MLLSSIDRLSKRSKNLVSSFALRKELSSSCNLHTVLDLPSGTFTGAGVKTVVLFFEKGKTSDKTWFYQLNLDRNLGKTNPLNEQDLAEFVKLQKTQAESDKVNGEARESALGQNSWVVRISDIDQNTFDLSAKNPNTPEEAPLRSPEEILKEMAELDKESSLLMDNLKLIIENGGCE